ncbi:protein IQ-DOMAIN 32-like isoform X1 [Salvia hispanica]|uniref:protein IQ-DOMAIN 32-like isoform X1 n=1 Tax=Salvia hispanica TaxID=49212 RepID=UPI002009B6E0|nr:protein IQ-DOMAIN 32-like isoform X1 [Salvia hispanica]
MGKSTASCFKIIACGSDSVDHGDLQTPQSKLSSARSGWSFRKRSARHQVLSNTIISEAPSYTESPEATVANLPVQPNLSVPEKASVIQWTDEKHRLSAQVDSNLSNVIATDEEECSVDATPKESSAILIQAAIRGYLVRRMLLKQKNIIKLQAAIRGHLVRRHAVGTLRCVLAIIKMQALIRARHIRLKGSGDFEKKKKISVMDGLNSTVLRSKTEAKANSTSAYISIKKLLGNKFASQLMESMPKTKSINIKCDPAKSDSAWKWLERWMSVSPVSNKEQDKSGSAPEQHEKENIGCEPKDLKSALGPSAESSENYENLITRDADNLDIHASSDPLLTSHPKLQNAEKSNSRYEMAESGVVEMMETGLIGNMEAKPVLVKYETNNQQAMHESEEFSFVQPEIERKRFPHKASNPSFIAAHSKFEELSSAGPPFNSGEIGLNNASLSNAVTIQVAGSECGTELSVTSTLDSPDMSDGGVYDLELEPKILEETDHPRSREKLEHEAFENSSILGTELSYANIDHLERNETVHPSSGEHVNSVLASESPPHAKKLESDQSNTQQVKPGSDAIHIVDKSLTKVSPRSNVTLPKSQAKLSSQVSVSPKKSNGGKVNSNEKKKSLSADKSSVSTPNYDSPTQSSLKPAEEPKSGKRRKSFGSTKLEFTDQEPREASSQNSLPSYMQPTKSARAKALSSGSLKSSPDAQDKDIILKNRPYHPGKNEREGSPRIQHSPSQAQQNAKGNDTHSPQALALARLWTWTTQPPTTAVTSHDWPYYSG